MMDGHHSSQMGKGPPTSIPDLWQEKSAWTHGTWEELGFQGSRAKVQPAGRPAATVGSRGLSWVTRGREDQKLLEEEKGKAARAEENASDLGERDRRGGRLLEFSAGMEERDDHKAL